MVTTELAALAFLRRNGWLSSTRFYRMMELGARLQHLSPEQRQAVERRSYTGIQYRSSIEEYDSMRAGDVILYWADFLHAAQYLREVRPLIAEHFAGRFVTEEGVTDLVHKVFLCSQMDESTLRRTMTFGTTLLFNTAQDELGGTYGTALRRMASHISQLWVRDALSAARVAHLRRDYRRGYFGVDAALFLRREDLPPEDPGSGVKYPRALAFFGREPGLRDKMTQLSLRVASAFQLPLYWLPWGETNAFPRLSSSKIPPIVPETSTTEELLGEITKASMVITDTYHLAMMSWNFGIPAVVGFPGTSTALADVSSGLEFNWRDKREALYSQYDALDFLVRPEELDNADAFERRITRIIGAMRDPALCNAIRTNMHSHADSIEADLRDEIAFMIDRGNQRL